MKHAQYITIFSNCGKFHLASKIYGVTRSYLFLCALALHLCFVEQVLVVFFLAQMHTKRLKAKQHVYLKKVSKWFNLSRE